MTPEGAIKKQVRLVLQRYKDIYYFMPVQTGYGATTLDYLGCWRGRFFAIETKAGKKKPSQKQDVVIAQMRAAGAKVFVINDDLRTVIELVTWLNGVSNDPDFQSEQTDHHPVS